jgi:ABC-type transport system substrate-binding protein
MKSTKSRWLAAISLALTVFAAGKSQASPPRYGGTLHVKLRTAAASLDPRQWSPGSLATASSEKLAGLVYDRLITLDDYGRFQPALATEWTHDPANKNWQFRMRAGVHFSDGSPFTPADAAAALQSTLGKSFEISAGENAINIRSSRPASDLVERLASGRNFVFRSLPDGTMLGTGPFFVVESIDAAPSELNPTAVKPAHMKFQANESCWAGRPFVDFVEVTLGEPALRQLFDLQIGKADIAEIAPDLVRKARQEGLRLWSSAPETLVALRFEDALLAPASDQLREALWLALDRDTMANVLLQKEAQPTAALLPDWLSGYAFLFESSMNLERAKQLRGSFPSGVAGVAQPLRLYVDTPGDLYKLMGERVAVNARQANLLVQVALPGSVHASALSPASGGLHLFAWHYESLSPREELEEFVKQWIQSGDLPANAGDPEQLFLQERRLLEERRVLPLVFLPGYVGLRTNVRNWSASVWGDWRLADVWLESEEASSVKTGAGSARRSSSARNPGAKP